jgi:hypothetical protein
MEQRAPNGFDNIEPVVSAQELAEGRLAGFEPGSVNATAPAGRLTRRPP